MNEQLQAALKRLKQCVIDETSKLSVDDAILLLDDSGAGTEGFFGWLVMFIHELEKRSVGL